MKKKLDLIDRETLDKTSLADWVKERPESKDFFWFPIDGKTIASYKKVKLFTKKITIPITIITLVLVFSQIFFYATSSFENSWYLWGAFMFAVGGLTVAAIISMIFLEDKRKFYDDKAEKLDYQNKTDFEGWLFKNKIRLDYKDRNHIYENILNQTYLYPEQEMKTQLITEDLRSFVLVKNKNGSLSLDQPYIERKTIQTTNFVYLNRTKMEKLGTEKIRIYKEQLQNRIKLLLTYEQSVEDHYALESYADSLKQLNELDNDYSTLSNTNKTFETYFIDALYQISEAVESKENNQIDKIGKKMSVLNKYLSSKKENSL